MNRSPALAKLRRLRGVGGLVVLGLLCRALIPVGFMPAAFGAGGPVIICHGGLAGEFFRRLEASRVTQAGISAPAAGHNAQAASGSHGGHGTPDDHAGHGIHGGHGSPVGHTSPGAPGGHVDQGAPHDHAPTADHEAWEHCPFGAAFGIALLAGDVAPDLPDLKDAFGVSEPSSPAPYRPVSSYRARAPPSFPIHS